MTDSLTNQAVDLIMDMASELHFRGCNEDHPLLRRSADLVKQWRAQSAVEAPAQDPTPEKLHLMGAQEVMSMDLTAAFSAGEFSLEDLTEAAFTFENQLTALHGDDNTIPYDAYTGMTDTELIKVIQTAVADICRIQS